MAAKPYGALHVRFPLSSSLLVEKGESELFFETFLLTPFSHSIIRTQDSNFQKVVIVGAGIIGTLTALELSNDPTLEVFLIDPSVADISLLSFLLTSLGLLPISGWSFHYSLGF